jgi:hypothetical protein
MRRESLSPTPHEERAFLSTYHVTVLFLDEEEATSQHSTPADVTTKLSEIIDALTDENGTPQFRSITITPLD